MAHKYEVGDILTNGHYHYLVEDIKSKSYHGLCYLLRCLDENRIMASYVVSTDGDINIKKVA